jgi:cystathionine beta-lyase
MDFEDLKKKIDRRTKMILISNPHNPVGRSWTFDELKQLSDICLDNNILMISDEIHSDLTLKPFRHTILATVSENVSAHSVTLTAPSKTFNMAGLATSSVIISDQRLRNSFSTALEKIHIGHGNIFGNIASTAAYTHGDAWLDQLLEYVGGNVDFWDSFLKTQIPKIKMIRPEATYMAWLDFRGLNMSDSDLKLFLIHKAGLGLSAGTDFGNGGEGFCRINLACRRKTVEEAAGLLFSAFK